MGGRKRKQRDFTRHGDNNNNNNDHKQDHCDRDRDRTMHCHFRSRKSQRYASSALSSHATRSTTFQIFCDLDGVLCDFEAAVRSLSGGIAPDDLPPKKLWSLVRRADRFYEHLPWTSDGKQLWDSIRHYQPNILTGVSMDVKCGEEKARWCRRELGVKTNHVHMADHNSYHRLIKGRPRDGVVNVITCWSRNKHYESGNGCVLIDDRESLAAAWVEKGGIFIHHTDVEQTLNQLRNHGIIIDHTDVRRSPKTKVMALVGPDSGLTKVHK